MRSVPKPNQAWHSTLPMRNQSGIFRWSERITWPNYRELFHFSLVSSGDTDLFFEMRTHARARVWNILLQFASRVRRMSLQQCQDCAKIQIFWGGITVL